jgi:hypothetical protein
MGLRAASASMTYRKPRLTGAPTRNDGSEHGDQPARIDPTSDDIAADGPVGYAGVDWSWSEHAVCAIDETGAAIEQFTVKHSAAGLGKLVTLLHLLDARLTVFVIASWQVTALRSRYGTAASKDDRFDAYLLADVLRTDRRRLTPLTVDSRATLGLRMLVTSRPVPVGERARGGQASMAHPPIGVGCDRSQARSCWACRFGGKIG